MLSAFDLPEPHQTLAHLLDAYYTTVGKTQKGTARLRWTIAYWKLHLGDTPVVQIQRRTISRHIESRRIAGKSNSTINREISVLSAAINYAIRRWGWSIQNPASGLYLKVPEGRLRWLSAEETTMLLAAARQSRAPHLYDFIQLALHTGMRRSEILRLDYSRIDLEQNRIHLEGQHTKNGRRRIVPINQTAQSAIKSRMTWNNEQGLPATRLFQQGNGRPVVQINTAFKNAVNIAGIEDFRLHDLRHTFASWLVGEGISLSEVRDLLGHSSIKQTERYAHLAPGRLASAVAVLDGLACT